MLERKPWQWRRGNARLHEHEVRLIKQMIRDGLKRREIIPLFGIETGRDQSGYRLTQTMYHHIKAGRAWKHVP